ncbi:VOC family protein [Anabaena sp. FACHB-1237]|uniref:VOC family protein n=1 Tax=Anabaena sp. FACHB-1237 TaxID=2692769 RepID=UPI001680A01B|nr:VOC family protein [Anabaena sp. FACHB-1237]MBD2138278.1 VOC family protein [Anabaena sp. FACHB-1237]
MEIIQSLHTAILITDLEQSEYFYSHILELKKTERPLKYPGIWYQIGNYQLHLIVAPTVPTDNQQEKWGQNPHIAFAVMDLEAIKKELTAKNYPFQASASGRPAIFIKDPDGNIIELNQFIE